MKTDILHILYTRYNLNLSFSKTRFGEPVLTPQWLEHRFSLFKNYCFASLKNQSNSNFEWLIYFDPSTPKDYLSRIQRLTSSFPVVKIILLDVDDNIESDIDLRVQSQLKEYVILTRIDNDDAFHVDFINKIQIILQPQIFKILNLRSGYSYDIRSGISFKQTLKSGPFFSVMEKVEERKLKSVRLGSHMLIDHSNSINYYDDSLWCQIIHSKNVSNFSHGSIRFNNSHLYPFGITYTTPKFYTILRFAMKHYLFYLPKARFRNFIIYFFDSIRK